MSKSIRMLVLFWVMAQLFLGQGWVYGCPVNGIEIDVGEKAISMKKLKTQLRQGGRNFKELENDVVMFRSLENKKIGAVIWGRYEEGAITFSCEKDVKYMDCSPVYGDQLVTLKATVAKELEWLVAKKVIDLSAKDLADIGLLVHKGIISKKIKNPIAKDLVIIDRITSNPEYSNPISTKNNNWVLFPGEMVNCIGDALDMTGLT